MKICVHDPKTKKQLYQNLTSEFFGTFVLTFFIVILTSLYINKTPLIDYVTLDKLVKVASLGGIMVFVYVAILIAGVIIAFERWSANLNPSISLYLYLTKLCSKRYTIQKMVSQFLGGILAGLMAFLMAYYTNHAGIVNNIMGGFNSENIASFGTKGSVGQIVSANFTALVLEMLAAMGLCFYLFSRQVKKDYRLVSVSLYFSFGIATLIGTGVIGFNPARSFGPVLFHDFYLISVGKLTAGNSEMLIFPMFLIGPIVGVVGFYFIDKKYSAKLERWFNKITYSSFKNKIKDKK